MLLGYAHAQPTDHAQPVKLAGPTDDSLRLYAVDIWQDPPQSWGPGRGVYLTLQARGLDPLSSSTWQATGSRDPRLHLRGGRSAHIGRDAHQCALLRNDV